MCVDLEIWFLPKRANRCVMNVSRKARCYQNHGKEICVRMRNNSRSFYIRDHITPAIKRTSSSSETMSNTYQRKKPIIYYCVFMIPIPVIIYIYNSLAFCSGSPAPLIEDIIRRTITFENDNNIIVYALKKIFPSQGIISTSL